MKKSLKNYNMLLIILVCCLAFQTTEAQFLKKLQKSANKTTKQVDSQQKEDVSTNTDETNNENEAIRPNVWSKYNFVPGDEIIFEDDLANEENGEFPSRWDLMQGNGENASLQNENIISLDNRSTITPLIDGDDYLPEVFTIEFDAYFNESTPTWQYYSIRLYPTNAQWYEANKGEFYYPIKVLKNGADTEIKVQGNTKRFQSYTNETPKNFVGWKHIALAFNKRTLKVFVDEYRALNIPNIKLNPQRVSIASYQHDPEGKIMAIKNIRIAQGGKKLYDRIVSDGKFVTRGILFDVNKASIKSESYGVINTIAKMMQEHSDLNFSIEGHTDSDGEATYNQELSLKRAEAVKEALINAGISAERLQTKGLGESVPLTNNASAEAKANNRRVEFVKL